MSTQERVEKVKEKGSFHDQQAGQRGQCAISARATQREQWITSTTFQHNYERAKDKCHKFLGCPIA